MSATAIKSIFVAEICFATGPRSESGSRGRVTIIVEGFDIRRSLDDEDASTIQEAIEYLLPTSRRIKGLKRCES